MQYEKNILDLLLEQAKLTEAEYDLQDDKIVLVSEPVEDEAELDHVEGEVVEPIIDPELGLDSELDEGDVEEKTYVGKYVDNCQICNNTFFSDTDNTEELECPVCYATGDDLVIVGIVKPIEEADKEELETKSEDEADEELEESKKLKSRKRVNESADFITAKFKYKGIQFIIEADNKEIIEDETENIKEITDDLVANGYFEYADIESIKLAEGMFIKSKNEDSFESGYYEYMGDEDGGRLYGPFDLEESKKLKLTKKINESVSDKKYLLFHHSNPDDVYQIKNIPNNHAIFDSEWIIENVSNKSGNYIVANDDEEFVFYDMEGKSLDQIDKEIYNEMKQEFNSGEDYYESNEWPISVDKDEFEDEEKYKKPLTNLIKNSYVDGDSSMQYQVLNLNDESFKDFKNSLFNDLEESLFLKSLAKEINESVSDNLRKKSYSRYKNLQERAKIRKHTQKIGENLDMHIDESSIENLITEFLNENYSNIKTFTLENARLNKQRELILEGSIKFKSGNSRKINFKTESININKPTNVTKALSEAFTDSKAFKFFIRNNNNNLVMEKLRYNYVTRFNGKPYEVSGTSYLRESARLQDKKEIK